MDQKPETKKYNVLKLEDAFELKTFLDNLVLEGNLVKTADGSYVYMNGWSDEKVRASMPFPVSEANCRGVREKFLGKLTSTRGSGSKARFNALEARVLKLETLVANMLALQQAERP